MKRSWQELSEEQRVIMEAAAQKVEKELRDQMTALEAEAFDFVKDKINVVKLTDDQLAQWQQLSTPVVEAFVKSAGPLGQQVVDAARAIK